MLIDAYQPEDVFARVPELAAQIDPVLQTLDRLLEDDQLYQQVRDDLGKRYRLTLVHGRHSTPVEVILRMLLCKHLYQWSFKETEERVKDSLVLRWFCRVYFARVPDETTLLRWLRTLRPETLHGLNDRVVELAKQTKVTKGRKLRLDATCVQTEIHHPTDSGLLVDSVRVLSRVVKRAKGLVADQVSYLEQTCRSRLRAAKQTAQRLHRQLRRKGADKEAEQKKLYQKLVETAEHMVRQATRVVVALGQHSTAQAQRLRVEAEKVLPLVTQVIRQTRSRVLDGKKVPSGEKVLSLFEPQTRAIPRHKGGVLVEFGRHVMLDEVEGGIVTRYAILEHPEEHGQAIGAVEHHCALFEHPPNLVAGDRGVHSAETESRLKERGVKRVAIPVEGTRSEERKVLEHTRVFRRGYRFRAGIEGRIASLRRDYGWRKSAYHGQEGMERWLGLGIIASNLRHIAQGKGT
ncbi:MAG: ISNCY family transposase [Ktedonobacteraceae bacterium]|nr:ISNCY family transposase [Ktedonobacteraceae bacterium]